MKTVIDTHINQIELKRLLNYDPKTGIFTRIVEQKAAKVGDIAGYRHPNGYVLIRLHSKRYLAHRLAWLYMTGQFPLNNIDHIDLIKENNSWSNLREADDFENEYNKNISKRNSTGYKGIWFNKSRNKWESSIVVRGKRTNLGRFTTANEASAARECFAKRHHGEFYKENANV